MMLPAWPASLDEFVEQVRRETERKVAAAVEGAKERFERERQDAEAEGRQAIEKARHRRQLAPVTR